MPGQPPQPQQYRPDNDPLARLILYSILAFPPFALLGEGLGMLLRLQDNHLYTTFLIGGWCAWLVGLGTAQALKRKVKQRQGLYAPPQRAMRLPPRPLGRGGWRTLCVALAVGVLILICTDGYIFALVGSGALSLFMFTTYLREQHVDHRRCYLRLEWILLGYSLPFLAITALVPLQVQWYPEAGSTLPHIGLHLFFPAMGTLVSTCLLEGFCLRRITRPPDARDERRLQLARLNRFQWFAWISWRVACVAGVVTCGTLLAGPILFAAYFPALPSPIPTVVTAEGSACFTCLVIVFICAVLDLRRKR